MSAGNTPNPDDPISHYINHLETVGRDPDTVRSYRVVLPQFRAFLNNDCGITLEEATEPECIGFISSLKDELALSTVRHYVGCVNRFYQFYSSRGTFDKNPMKIALQEIDVTPQNDRHRREISLNDMREFIQNTFHPQLRTILVLFGKTGMRAGELVNLDLRDFYIDHPEARRELPEHRPELDGKPDSLFIADNRISEGNVVNGERRTAGNKRKNATIVPLDNELKQTALYWLAARPPSRSEASPLFLMRRGSSNRQIGDRATARAIRAAVRIRAEERGWYTKGAGVQNNVTPHYFRHWFTTMADRQDVSDMSRSVVKYIRGDVGSDIVDSILWAGSFDTVAGQRLAWPRREPRFPT